MKGPLENIVVSGRGMNTASDTPCFLPCRPPFFRRRRRLGSKPTTSSGGRELKSLRNKKRKDTLMGIFSFLVAEVGFEPSLPSCGAQNRRALLLVADDFDRYAKQLSLPPPQAAVEWLAPGTRRS